MNDYSKINNLINGSEIQKLLDFPVQYSQHTGEELTEKKRSVNLSNLIFTRRPDGSVSFSGSTHQYANGGKLNNDRFNIDRFRDVADELSRFISPDDNINVHEFGVNPLTPFDPTDLIKNLISHRKTQFNKIINSGQASAEIRYTHFTIKIYNKGLHQPTGRYILRIELHYLKMKTLFPDGLKWSQLADLKTWGYLGDRLKDIFSDVIYYDPSINLNQIPEKERRIIERGNNPIYWRDIKSNHADRERKQFQGLIKKYGSKFNNLSELISQEVAELAKSYHNSGEAISEPDLSELAKSYHYSEPEDFTPKVTSFDPLAKSYPLLSSNNSPTPILTTGQRFCKVTGINISMQKDGSKFLSISGLRFLHENDPSTFDKLMSKRLSQRWENESLKVQFRELAHSIRNEYFNPKNNPRNNTLKGIENLFSYPSLFDIRPFIRPEKMELAGMI